WLHATLILSPGVPHIEVAVDLTGLAAGTYQGAVNIASPQAAGPVKVPVTLVVWSSAPAITVAPASLSFATQVRSTAPAQTVSIDTGGVPMNYNVAVSSDASSWLGLSGPAPAPFQQDVTPATISVFAYASTLAPGVYHGTLTVTAPPFSSNAATVSVTFTVTPGPPPLPVA